MTTLLQRGGEGFGDSVESSSACCFHVQKEEEQQIIQVSQKPDLNNMTDSNPQVNILLDSCGPRWYYSNWWVHNSQEQHST